MKNIGLSVIHEIHKISEIHSRTIELLAKKLPVVNALYVSLAAICEYLQRLGTSRPPYRFAVLGFSSLVRRFDQPQTEAAFL